MRSRYINLYFLLPALLFIIALLFVLLVTPKGQPELFINRHNNIVFDWFFYLITEIGQGWFLTIVSILLLVLFKIGDGLFLGMQGIMVSICINICKHVIFTDAPRPPAFFANSVTLHFVKGSEIYYTNSFPSGHTMTAFCMFCTLSFFAPRKQWGIFFSIMAMLVAVSRMYLLKHFAGDVFAGATGGIVISVVTLLFIYPAFEKVKLFQKPLWNKLTSP